MCEGTHLLFDVVEIVEGYGKWPLINSMHLET